MLDLLAISPRIFNDLCAIMLLSNNSVKTAAKQHGTAAKFATTAANHFPTMSKSRAEATQRPVRRHRSILFTAVESAGRAALPRPATRFMAGRCLPSPSLPC
jgi:hypothetical protein